MTCHNNKDQDQEANQASEGEEELYVVYLLWGPTNDPHTRVRMYVSHATFTSKNTKMHRVSKGGARIYILYIWWGNIFVHRLGHTLLFSTGSRAYSGQEQRLVQMGKPNHFPKGRSRGSFSFPCHLQHSIYPLEVDLGGAIFQSFSVNGSWYPANGSCARHTGKKKLFHNACW